MKKVSLLISCIIYLVILSYYVPPVGGTSIHVKRKPLLNEGILLINDFPNRGRKHIQSMLRNNKRGGKVLYDEKKEIYSFQYMSKKKRKKKRKMKGIYYIRNSNFYIGRKKGDVSFYDKKDNALYAEEYKISLTDKPIIEEVPRNVKGRINEWIAEFDENNTLGFFPILLEEMSNEPSPLQIGFEDYMQFNGEYVEDIFKNMTRDIMLNGEKKKIFGMCFFNHKTGVLAPLAVYAEIKDVTKVGSNLAVKGLIRGRIIIDEIISQEPCILGKISPIEDKKGLIDPEESLKIVDEIIRIHSQCTNMESQLMEQLDQSFASMNIKLRNDLKESIDAKLEKFQIDPSDIEQRQAFIQIASFAAFDFHLMIVDRYDALMLQNSEDRLRLVRDKIRQKQKQLAIIKNTPKEKLQEILEQVHNLKNQNASMPNFPKT
ncbi:conserved Plasmodium protein, unknown function [Plasmodium ovale]|uniref:Lon N-terminal domain-containing protein n=2 Tax=Plasmodium ovale TaxID=36330 RepID=A0A1A8W3F9_PLAOA|nr:conserved Plasmodium protein, unknown function [Plasmodium ovale curtisi]SBS96566.1 conserved Plasmodium protein, unknown function [Plasmodium ovale curtisi]SCP05524.1 conserved Plasmodium protein, unknown function [Plasmodium ovale]